MDLRAPAIRRRRFLWLEVALRPEIERLKQAYEAQSLQLAAANAQTAALTLEVGRLADLVAKGSDRVMDPGREASPSYRRDMSRRRKLAKQAVAFRDCSTQKERPEDSPRQGTRAARVFR